MNTMNAGDWEWAHSMAVERNKILAAKVDATNARLTTANARIARLRAECKAARDWQRPRDDGDYRAGESAWYAARAAVDQHRDLEGDDHA